MNLAFYSSLAAFSSSLNFLPQFQKAAIADFLSCILSLFIAERLLLALMKLYADTAKGSISPSESENSQARAAKSEAYFS